MPHSRVSSSTGLLATFASSATHDNDTRTNSRALTIVGSRKRVRSQYELGKYSFDSLALIPSNEDESKVDDSNRKKTRIKERSRPRAVGGAKVSSSDKEINKPAAIRTNKSGRSINRLGQRNAEPSTVHVCENIRRPIPKRPGSISKQRPSTSDLERQKYNIVETHNDEEVSDPAVVHENPQVIFHADNDDDDDDDDLLHVNLADDSVQSNNVITHVQNAQGKIIITPPKVRADEEKDPKELFHNNKKSLKSDSLEIVTPSPSRTPTKEKMSKRRRLKRVSKLRAVSSKKPVIALTQAVSAGNKTIPARHTLVVPQDKKCKEKKHGVSVSREDIVCSNKLDSSNVCKSTGLHSIKSAKSSNIKPSELKIVNGMQGGNENDTRVSKTGECSEIKSPVKKIPRKRTTKQLTIRENHKQLYFSPKSQILDFLDEMMDTFKQLKDQVNKCDDEGKVFVPVEELRKRFIPLSTEDIFVDTNSQRGTKTTQAPFRETWQSWPSVKMIPWKPLQPAKAMANDALYSCFFDSKYDGDESCCESVIDLGVVSDSQALLRHLSRNKISPDETDDEDHPSISSVQNNDDHMSEQSVVIPCKRDPEKSRIVNRGSDVLATVGVASNLQVKNGSSVRHLLPTESRSISAATSQLPKETHPTDPGMPQLDMNDSGTPVVKAVPMSISINSTTDSSADSAKSKSLDQILYNQLQELLDMDSDEMIQEELRGPSLYLFSNVPIKSFVVDTVSDDDDECSHQSHESTFDDLFMSVPTISY